MTGDEKAGWHHQLNGHEFEQAPGVGEGQEGLPCCSPWGCKSRERREPLQDKTGESTLLSRSGGEKGLGGSGAGTLGVPLEVLIKSHVGTCLRTGDEPQQT